ncbi:dihydrodipicolinate reductase [Candidatus Bathyarchaeota archaeon]|nr:dihydrodipicolinate reductase [Candidatus Bathyarchaeota archaeon]
MKTIRVVSYGVGVIGRRIAEHLLSKEGVEIVGAIDIDPNKVGKDLGELLGRQPIGVVVSDDVDDVISSTKPDIIVHSTASYLKDTYPQFEEILKHGVDTISTCEELSFPYATEEGKAYAEKLDKLAKENGVTLLGTGINPGFLMDTLPLLLTGVCIDVRRIEVARQMNAATRRIPFQKKIGAGLTVEEFKKKIEGGEITGHVGLVQSIGMIADTLGWVLDRIEVEPVEPVVLDRDVRSDYVEVPKGYNAGLRQKAHGIMDGEKVITLDFRAYIGAEEEYDSVTIDGVPPIHQKISPCVHGDYGTVGVIINMIPRVIEAEPGLKTMRDLPLIHATPVHMGRYLG